MMKHAMRANEMGEVRSRAMGRGRLSVYPHGRDRCGNAACPSSRWLAECLGRSRRAGYLAASLASLVALVGGCGEPSPPATAEGTLRMQGEPLDNCLITFLPEPGQVDAGPHATGVTDENGHYRLRLPDQREGVSIGWHRVMIEDLSVTTGVPRRDHGSVGGKVTEGAKESRDSRVPARYSSPADTPLKKEVKPGPHVIDFDIQ